MLIVQTFQIVSIDNHVSKVHLNTGSADQPVARRAVPMVFLARMKIALAILQYPSIKILGKNLVEIKDGMHLVVFQL